MILLFCIKIDINWEHDWKGYGKANENKNKNKNGKKIRTTKIGDCCLQQLNYMRQ